MIFNYDVSDLQNQVNSKLPLQPEAIEMMPNSASAGHGGFIDFHFNRDSGDRTSRIIESASGVVEISPKLTLANPLEVASGGTGNSSVDTTPTANSTKMVTSGGVYTAISSVSGAISVSQLSDLSGGASHFVSFNVGVSVGGVTIPQYSKGVLVASSTSDATLYAIDSSGNLYTAFRNGGTWVNAKTPSADIATLQTNQNQLSYLVATPSNVTVAPATNTLIASLQLTKGVWSITSTHEWSTAFTQSYQDAIYTYVNGSFDTQVAIQRSLTGVSGGGAAQCGLYVAAGNTELRYYTYNGSDTDKVASKIRLCAVKVHD